MVVGESTRTANIMEGIGNTGDVRMHDHRLRLKQRFDIVRKLGQGTYGKVQLGINKKTGQEVAIKTIKKCKIESDADLVRIRREVQIMSSVRHPNIVHIYEVFENSEKMILVMEYCSGGELYDYLSQQKVLPEEEARRLFRQIATAVYYCHIHKICHRDLKLENVLLDETGSAKIADFGLSNVFKETSLLATFCGSPLYASPEIVKGTPYIGPEVDCWSLGVLLYTLVYGAMPFDGSNFKRLVRQISNGDYFEPKSPSSASPLIRDMLTVDPIQRADITYICDHPWVNMGCEVSCLEMSEALATETPVRLDLLLSLAPPAPERTLLLPAETNTQSDPSALDESATDLTSSTMAVEPSTSAEKRILDLVAEGGADAIKPSPTRTIVSAGAAEAGKRKLEQAASTGSATALAPHRKKERVASAVRLVDVPPSEPPVPEEPTTPPTPPETAAPAVPEPAAASPTTTMKPSVKCSATVTTIPKEAPKEELPEKSTGARPRVALKKKLSPTKSVEERPAPEKLEEAKSPQESVEKPSGVAAAADKLTGLSLAQPTPAPTTNHTTNKPKKLSIAGMSVGSFKEQFERRASLTSPPDVKKNLSTKAVVAASKIAKPKAQSEDRDIQLKSAEPSSVRLQQIGIDPSPVLLEENARVGGVKKTESEPCNRTPADPVALSLQDARRSLQNSMAMLSEQRAQPGEDSRRRAARDIISTAIRTGKPPMPYGRSSSAGVTSLATPPPTPPAAPPTAPIMSAPRTFRTEALHTIGDHRNRGTSVERIIPIQVSSEDLTPSAPATSGTPVRMPTVPAVPKTNHVPLRRLASDTSTKGSEYGSTSSIGGSSTGEPIKKSAREFIIPIAVEGKGYVTPRQGSLEPETAASVGSVRRHGKPRRISLVSGGESEDEDDMHMHKLRSSRAARAESVSSGEEEDDEGFQLLTAENLFSTLLHRVRALTNRLNGEEGTGFPQHPHSLFNNLQSPFFNSPHLSRHHRFGREGGWPTTGPRDLAADFDTMFKKRSPFPRGSNIKKSSKQQTNAQPNTEKENSGLDLSDLDLSSIQLSEKELEALSGLTPALSRRLQKQLLAHLPPAAARTLRRTLSMQNTNLKSSEKQQHYTRSQSASKSLQATPTDNRTQTDISSACSDKTEPSETATLDSSRTDNIAGETAAVVTPSPLTTAIDSIPTITTSMTTKMSSDEAKQLETLDTVKADEEFTRKELDVSIPQFSTLPRLKRHSILSRESTPPVTPASDSLDVTPKSGLPGKDLVLSRGSSVRSTPDRSLLSKYLTPERTISLEESYSSDSGSLLSEPSYIAAYGSSPLAGLSSVGSLRRHSMRLQGDQSPRKRISRFLRPDFFDTPKDESVYARTKKDKELETQKILKEIREKRNKNSDATSPRSPISNTEMQQIFKDEMAYPRPCFSPLSIIATRERSRSTTPFFPMLNKIKETAVDSLNKTSVSDNGQHMTFNNEKEKDKEKSPTKESRLTRPKSFPIKSILDDNTEKLPDKEIISQAKSLDTDDPKSLQKESKLVRPKSYPTSSPSPEKIYVTRNNKKDDKIQQENMNKNDNTDIEVSFRINLPKKSIESQKTETFKSVERDVNISVPVNITVQQKEKETTAQSKDSKEQEKMSIVPKDQINKTVQKSESSTESAQKSQGSSITTGKAIKTDNVEEKRPTIKKKIIKKVSTKSKSVENGTAVQETSNVKAGEKKKVTRKAKDSTTENEKEKSPVKKVVTKKKSVLQSIGHKLEKLTSSKSNSPEKEKTQEAVQNGQKSAKLIRNQREHSVPIQTEAEPTESSLIKRAVTLTNVVGLNNEPSPPTKTTVSKVLGLFKKFEPKEKPAKPPQPLPVSQEKKAVKENQTIDSKTSGNDKNVSNEIDSPCLNTIEKPKRPTSLLLNGLGRKSKYCGAASDGALSPPVSNDNSSGYSDKTSELDNKKVKNNLKLDFSRLPRVKTNSCSKSRSSDPEKFSDFSSYKENDDVQSNGITHNDKNQANGPDKLVTEAEFKPRLDKEREGEKTSPKILYCGETTTNHPHRNHESTIPEKEDIEERIRRKSFYTRFNEKRHKRKSNLVGPGAQDYNPAARLHSQPGGEAKYDVSPTSPNKHYDLSPNYPTYDLSPTLNCEHSRSFNPDSPSYLRHTSRLDNYGASDRLDNYRSLDRNSTRKYTRSYLDPDAPVSYTSPRYSRTISLFDSEDDDKSMGQQDQHKYNRTLSMYSPGNYATYRPKRIRNPAILLKENEKEISPENILEKIRERKRASGGASSKEAQMESRVRSNIPSKSESNGAERPEKVD